MAQTFGIIKALEEIRQSNKLVEALESSGQIEEILVEAQKTDSWSGEKDAKELFADLGI